jgi:ABC-type multidrug transport system ATPase subunit
MTALVLEAATKRFRHGMSERTALDNVSLDIDAREVVGVWGRRRSGRTTLIRVAAGILPPDEGAVLVNGIDVSRAPRRPRREARASVALWYPLLLRDHGRTVLRQVAVPARRGRRPFGAVYSAAANALERVGISECARVPIKELDHRELVRAALARALVMRPRVLLLDDPLSGLDVLEAQSVLELIVRIAREDRIGVLLTASDPAQLGGVDRHLSISGGRLRGATTPTPADVVELRRSSPSA